MATTTRYTLLGSGANFMDFCLPYGTLSLDGQELFFKGSSGVDQVYVGSAVGLTFDFTQASGSVDKVFLSGSWADYSRSASGSALTLTRTVGGSEVIRTISGDSLAFADGTVSVLDALNFAKGLATEPVPTGEASTTFPMTVAGTLSNTVRAVVQDSTGETIAMVRPGVALIVKGGSGVDVVYVNAGTNVDGTQLSTGTDKIYLMGHWADYTGSFSGAAVTLTRTVGTDTETVKFLGGSDSAFDNIVFADGTARSVDILKFLNGTGGAPTLSTVEVTPLPGPSVSIATDDSALNVGDTATLTFTLSEAPSGNPFTAGDITVTGGALSNFSGSGTSYTATFTPNTSLEGTATVDVAGGVFTNAAAQNNTASQTLTMTVDTLAPTLAITSNVSAVKVGETATVTFTFSEVPTGFVPGDVITTGGTLSDPTVTADTKVYTATFTPTVGFEGSASITVASGAYTDAAGNTGGAGATPTVSIDTLAPNTTLSSAAYSDSTGVLSVTGTNLGALGVANGTDVKAQLDWTKLTWDINGDGTTTTDKTFAASEIASAVVANATTLAITLTVDAHTALEAMTGFGATGGGDTLDVAAGFISDAAGNLAATDGLVNGPIVTDNIAPTTTLTSGAYNSGTGVLTLTGSNLDTLGVANGTDVKGQLDWTKLSWDINGDGTTTADKTFAVGDITSAVVTNATTLTITLTSGAKALLEATSGFAAAGTADTLDVTAGFIKDAAGNAASSDTLANGTISYSDATGPTVTKFDSTAAAGAYNAGDTINITATMNETVLAGATFNVTLDTNDVVTLTAASTGLTLSGTYTVGAGDSSNDLTVNSYTAGTVSDLYGNAMAATTLPVGQNLANNEAIVIDTTAPTATVASGTYNNGTVELAVTGSNLDTLGVANGTDVKALLNWANLTWDINGDAGTTADKTFTESDIVSAVVTNATTLTVTLTSSAKAALEGMAGFGAAGTADKLDVTAGFFKDTAGNPATTDAVANGAISYSDVTGPAVTSFSSTTVAGAYNAGDTINITATMTEAVLATATFNVTLDTNDVVTLLADTADATGRTLIGTYTVGAGDSSNDLTVNSYTAGTVSDVYGNAMATTTLPTGQNLANNEAIVIDTAAPTATLTSAVYNNSTGVMTVTGTSLDTLGAANGTDVKAQLNWANLAWDINGDNTATADKTFVAGDITSAVVTNLTTLTVTLTSSAKAALEATAGFGAAGGADRLDVTAGFFKDTAGNVATADLLANGAISYSDVTAPGAASTAPTAAAGPAINDAEEAAGFAVVAALTGTSAVAGDVVELKLGGNSFATPLTHTLTANDILAGSVSFTIAANSLGADGPKSLTAVVTDVFGNVGGASPALALTLDTTAPAAGNAPTAAAGPTINAAEAAAGFSVVAPLPAGAAVGDILELKLNAGQTLLTRTLTSGDVASGSFTFTVTGTDLGSDGSKSLTSVVTDAAGNIGAASTALSLTLDTAASRSIAYSTATFVEAAANNGSIHTTATLTLSGDTFTGTDGLSLNGASFQNVPAGLTARVTKTSSTTATLDFINSAGQHADADDIANLTVVLGNEAFTAGSATTVSGATKSDLAINFADPGLVFSGNSGINILSGTTGKDIIYGNGGADVINGLAGNDTIDITDSGTTSASSTTILVTSDANGSDTIVGFKGGALSSGGDLLDFTGFMDLTDSVAAGLSLTSNFAANNVFIFNSTQVSIADASAAIAADADVVADHGYIVIADSANAGRVTVFHSHDLAGNSTSETALIVLSGVSISSLTAENFLV